MRQMKRHSIRCHSSFSDSGMDSSRESGGYLQAGGYLTVEISPCRIGLSYGETTPQLFVCVGSEGVEFATLWHVQGKVM